MEVEDVVACETTKEIVWLMKFLHDLKVVPNMNFPTTLCCDNNGAVANSKEPHNHKEGKNQRKYHLIQKIVQRRDMIVTTKITSKYNIVDSFVTTHDLSV